MNLRQLLAPRSIAVLGASADVSGHGGRTIANLDRTGYAGAVYPVNPRYGELHGHTCYPSLSEVPGPVDVAYILLRADRVPDAVRDCVEHGIGQIVVCSSGFAELGASGRALQDRVTAAAGDSRVLGPNCIGVLNIADNVIACPTFNLTYDYTPGSVSIVSQSGGMGVNLVNRAQGRRIGIRAMVSVGNECDLDVAELVDAFVDDPATRVIALLVEQLRDGPRFVAAVGRARAAGKPVVALKVGRSDAGQRSAYGHTGAMAGGYAVFSDVLRQLGVIEARSVDELINTCALLAEFGPPRGNRLAVVSPSGGECSYVADRAADRGLDLPDLSPDTFAALSAMIRLGIPGNPFDPTGQIIGDGSLLSEALALLTADDAFDLVHFAIPTWGPYDAERLFPRFIEAARAAGKPAVISAWTAGGLTEAATAILRDSGVPHFDSADEAVDALGLFAAAVPAPYRARSVAPVEPGALPPELTEYDCKRMLAAAGLPVSREVLAPHADAAVAAAETLGWPVVAKLLVPGVVHKSDLGHVAVGVRDAADLRRRLAAWPSADVLIAEQASGLEVIVGGVHDATFGPVVMVGAGGVLAEYLPERAFRLCPLTAAEARAAIDDLPIGRILRGARGVSYDVDALSDVVARFSEFFAGAASWLAEADLNPVIVGPTGATIVDAALMPR